jgi:hypothetical protein
VRVRLFLAVVATVAGFGVFHYLRALDVRVPPVLALRAPEIAPHPRSRVRRVVWVLIDGLRLDASRTMPTLNRLRREGADFAGRAGFPSYSIPNYVVEASGLEPADSGVRTNGFPEPPALDSVFRRAHRAGLRVTAVGTDTPWFDRFYPGDFDQSRIAVEPTRLVEGDLELCHLDYPDDAAHAHGAASPEYHRAVLHSDAVLAELVARLDPARDTLAVTADHGHLARGGHGGAEDVVMDIPIVLWGAGVPRGAPPTTARGIDVGPTLAHLLGLGPLLHARGRSLLGEDAAAAAQRRRVEGLLDAHAQGRAVRLLRARLFALGFALPVLLLLGLVALHAHAGVRGWLLAPVYLVALALVYRLADTVSFSTANHDEPFMVRFVALASAAAIAQLVLGGRRSAGPATFCAGLVVAGALWLAPERPLYDLPGPAETFFPVLAFGALAVVAGWAAVWGRFGGQHAAGPRARPRGGRSR